jgi:hypothetical protein
MKKVNMWKGIVWSCMFICWVMRYADVHLEKENATIV